MTYTFAGSAAGAGAGTTITVQSGYVTTGDVTLPNTSGAWQSLTGFELAIAADDGDHVDLEISALRSQVGTGFLDIALKVGSSLVWFASSGTSTPAVEGDAGWGAISGFPARPAHAWVVAASGLLDGGQLRWVVAARAAGSGTLFASTNYPFRWRTLNYGAL